MIRKHLEVRGTGGSDTWQARISQLLDMEVPEWMAEAVCAQVDPDSFFPTRGGSTKAAKLVCKGCPVTIQCLERALATDERHGVWGGTSERDRRKIQRQRQREVA